MRLRTFVSVGLVGTLWIGCGGDDDDKKAPSGGGSYTGIANSIANPTGTLSEGNATSVAEEFAKISSSSLSGARLAQGSSQTVDCDSGNITVNASSAGQGTFTYNDCCFGECCFGGGGTIYFATQEATYSYCASYNISFECTFPDDTESGTSTFQGCVGQEGWVYVVRVEGETFAVTGHYSDGNGQLTITGANGTYTCTYTDGSGTCTGDGGEFSF